MGAEHCKECGCPLDAGQNYCLACGARVGSRSPLLAHLMLAAGNREPAQVSPGPKVPSSPPAATAWPGRRLPPARVCALLVLAFLGFGVTLGAAAGSRVDDTLAASARRLKVVLPPARPPAVSAPPSSPAAAEGSSEPPSAGAEPTPEPAPATPAPMPKPATPSAPSSGSPSSSPQGVPSGSPSPGAAPTKLPPVKHVFVVMLSNEPYAAVFGPASAAPYLSHTLERQGELLVRYDAVAHEELANGVALLSGQGPTAETAANCPTYTDIAPATIGGDEQVRGGGCVYPATTKTLLGQLAAKHLASRAYVQGIDEAPTQPPACAHPVPGGADPTASATATGAYATFRNPLVYFHSLTDVGACVADDVGLDALKADLTDAKRAPSFSYIVPDRCHDGDPTPCAPGAAAGMLPADGLLKQIVPEITASKAYRDGGLLVITVDESPSSGEFADSSSCCGQPQFPNLPAPTTGLSPRGGGTVGALLLSPFVKGGSTNQEPYSHFSLLRTIEDLFALKHLGYAGLSKVNPFEPAIFSASAGG